MKTVRHTWFIAVFAVLISCGAMSAQTVPTADAPQPATTLVDATNQYKASSAELLAMQQDSINKDEAKLAELRQLVTEGLIAKAELDEAEQRLATLRVQLQTTQKQITDSDHMIAEIQAEQELAKARLANPIKLLPKQTRGLTTPTMLRYNGPTAWSIGGLHQIQSFFTSTFGRGLPTSAVGQSATHNRLGYAHHNAVDVALHPDSSEGRALIGYLQSRGIPFLAFRGAIPGVATGPHIHIGSPSHRL